MDHLPPSSHPGIYLKVWMALMALTLALALISRAGPGLALAGVVLLTPLKAGLILAFFMHLREEGPLLRGVLLISLGTLLIFFVLLYSDLAFR